MTTRASTEKTAKKGKRWGGRLCAMLLIAALMLSLTPSAFAAGSGKLSVTPKTLLDDEYCTIKVVSAAGQEGEEDRAERFTFSLTNKADRKVTFAALETKINGISVEGGLNIKLKAGETGEQKLSFDKTLMTMAGISKIKTLTVSFALIDESNNTIYTDWLDVPVKDTRKSPYSAFSAKSKDIVICEHGARLTVLGMDQYTRSAPLLYFLVENVSETAVMLYRVRTVSVNGKAQDSSMIGLYYLDSGEKFYGYAFLENGTKTPIETAVFSVAYYDDQLNSYSGQVSADLSGAEVVSSASEQKQSGTYSDEELLKMAKKAEESAEYYSTVSNQKVALELPKSEFYLSEAKRMEVKFTSSGSIYIMPKPASGNGVLGAITAGTEVTVIAERRGYYFFIADDGRMGWNGKDYFITPQS